MNDLINFLEARLDEDERIALRALHWPDDECQPPGRSGLFAHGHWVRRYAGEGSGDQIIRTATDAEGQLPEDWPADQPVPDGWIQPHPIAAIPEVPNGPELARWLGDHVARHDPARVLADVKARRRLLAFLVVLANEPDLGDAWWRLERSHPAPLRLLAAPYASHPDYRKEWAA